MSTPFKMRRKPFPEKSAVNSQQESEILALIARLDQRDLSERERAATQLFARGCERARRSTAGWFEDGDLAGCFVMDDSGFPQTTVGIAVGPEKFAKIREANGRSRLADVPPDLDAEEFELHFAGGIRLDVLTARDPRGDGAIARFLSKRGEGIQQVELLVSHLDRATDILRSRFGAAPVYSEGRQGADRTRVNFFLLSAGNDGKLLIELVELPAND
jgi:hypothetical protein